MKYESYSFKPSPDGEGWVDGMDAGGRAMQEQLPGGEIKIYSFFLNLMAVTEYGGNERNQYFVHSHIILSIRNRQALNFSYQFIIFIAVINRIV